MQPLKTVRIAAWAIAAGVGLIAIALSLGWFEQPATTSPTSAAVTIGGPFSLVNTEGRPVTDADYAGKAKAIFFGFTNCPDVCPTTLLQAGGWLNALGPDADKLNFIFVTVDPARDTPEQVKLYLSSFDPRIIGLTGTQQQVDDIVRAFRVYARKVPLEGSDYTMDHSAAVLLFNANGRFTGTLDYHEPDETSIAKLKRLVGAS